MARTTEHASGFAAIYVRHTGLPRELRPSGFTTVALWVSTAVMLGFAAYYAVSTLS